MNANKAKEWLKSKYPDEFTYDGLMTLDLAQRLTGNIQALAGLLTEFASQQPTEKTRKKAINQLVKQGLAPREAAVCIDTLIQHGLLQSDSVDAELYVGDVTLDKWIGEMYLEFKSGESGATMAANLGERIEKYFTSGYAGDAGSAIYGAKYYRNYLRSQINK